MKKAGERFNPPMEYFEIPFEGTVLPGFFRKAAIGTNPTKILIMIGGGFVPQAAMHDTRIKAIAMNSAVVDAYPLFATMPVVLATQKEIDSWTTFHGNIVKAICWRWGVPMDKPSGLADANKGFTFDPAKIDVPSLIIVGEGEYKSQEVKRQQQVCMDNFHSPLKRIEITPTIEGASNHCVMENRSLVSQVLFDWLDEVFK